MPIHWEAFNIGEIVDREADATDEELASRVSSLTRMTDEEVQELFPKKADVEKLGNLMRIVKSAENQNSKRGRIVSNAEEFGEIIIKLLDRFV